MSLPLCESKPLTLIRFMKTVKQHLAFLSIPSRFQTLGVVEFWCGMAECLMRN